MSSPSNGNSGSNAGGGGGGGAYVPPHRRAQQAGKMPTHLNLNSPNNQHQHRSHSPHNHNNYNNNNNKSPRGGRQQQGRQGRSPATSPMRNKNHHHNNNRNNHNNNNKSKSPKRNNNNNNNRHYHHSPTRKEDLALQKQQMHVLQDALDRICCINLERRPDRWQSFQQHLHQSLGKKMGHALAVKVEQIAAVDGIPNDMDVPSLVNSTWDATENSKWDRHITPPMQKEMSPGEIGCALSHVQLWKQLAATPPKQSEDKGERQANMMILEDDSLFYSPKLAMNKAALGKQQQQQQAPQSPNNNNNNQDPHHNHYVSIANHDFLTAFQLAWSKLPEDWDIWYLGFSDRGERLPVDALFELPKQHHNHSHEHHQHHYPTMSIQMFRPTYGFHTHGYVISARGAQKLLENLPVQGPLDVWLADNQWFGLNVYCSVVEGEGWRGTGAWLITQNRKSGGGVKDTDIGMSGRKDVAAAGN